MTEKLIFSPRHIGFGYGGVQSKISERARSETNSYDISANISVDKLLPQWTGLKIPMFISYENTTIDPKYDPANPDLRLEAALKSFDTQAEKDAYTDLIRDKSIRRSLNFTNVRKVKTNKDAKAHIYDIENFAFTYAQSEATQTNFNLQENTRRNYKGAIAWQYSPKFKGFDPFKDMKFLSSPFLQLINDFNFNPLPSNISVRYELDRSFSKMTYRNANTDALSSVPNFQKFFVFNRTYNVRWSLAKSLTLDYSARVNAIIDEPDGDLDNSDSMKIVIENLKKFGRTKTYDQNITANYTVPQDKFPLTNWLGAEYRYNVGYNWKAGPLETTDSLRLGNIVQNSQEQALSGRVDMVKLYNKIGFLKNINTPKRQCMTIGIRSRDWHPAKPGVVFRPECSTEGATLLETLRAKDRCGGGMARSRVQRQLAGPGRDPPRLRYGLRRTFTPGQQPQETPRCTIPATTTTAHRRRAAWAAWASRARAPSMARPSSARWPTCCAPAASLPTAPTPAARRAACVNSCSAACSAVMPSTRPRCWAPASPTRARTWWSCAASRCTACARTTWCRSAASPTWPTCPSAGCTA